MRSGTTRFFESASSWIVTRLNLVENPFRLPRNDSFFSATQKLKFASDIMVVVADGCGMWVHLKRNSIPSLVHFKSSARWFKAIKWRCGDIDNINQNIRRVWASEHEHMTTHGVQSCIGPPEAKWKQLYSDFFILFFALPATPTNTHTKHSVRHSGERQKNDLHVSCRSNAAIETHCDTVSCNDFIHSLFRKVLPVHNTTFRRSADYRNEWN